MRSCVSFEIECVVESFATDCTKVSLDVAMALDVSTEHALLWEDLPTDATFELVL